MPRKPADLTPKRKNKHYFFVFPNGPQDPPKTSGFLEKPAEIEKTNGSEVCTCIVKENVQFQLYLDSSQTHFQFKTPTWDN